MASPVLRTVPYKIEIADSKQSLSTAQHGAAGVGASITYRVPLSDHPAAIREILGYAKKNTTSATIGGMERLTPLPHPTYNWLYASSIEVKGEGAGRKQQYFGGGFDDYDFYLYTVSFEPRPYKVRSDSEVPLVGGLLQEYARYTQVISEPGYEFAQVGRGVFRFDSGPSAGKSLPSGYNLRLNRSTYALRWFEVPHDWIFDSNDRPTVLLDSLGRVNLSTWRGFRAETLLFDQYALENPRAQPAERNFQDRDQSRIWDVVFLFRYFDATPESGTASGWNFSLTADLTWHPISVAGLGGTTPFLPVNFDELFKAVS